MLCHLCHAPVHTEDRRVSWRSRDQAAPSATPGPDVLRHGQHVDRTRQLAAQLSAAPSARRTCLWLVAVRAWATSSVSTVSTVVCATAASPILNRITGPGRKGGAGAVSAGAV
jgi:hypothetical protein